MKLRPGRSALQVGILAAVAAAGWLYGASGDGPVAPAPAEPAPVATGDRAAETSRTYIIDAESATVVVQQPDVLIGEDRTAGTARLSTSQCRDADTVSAQLGAERAKRSLLCLINAERRRRRLPSLRTNRQLLAAGRSHTRDMVRNRYFRHDSLDGKNFARRILARGYVRRTQDYVVAENLAWGGGRRGTPAAIVEAWLSSPPHRANLLDRRFRDIGVAVELGSPVPEVADAVTVATEYGVRR